MCSSFEYGTSDRYKREQEFFDRVAERSRPPAIIPRRTIERYRRPRRPSLYPKEYMFSRAHPLSGKRVLEIGCGQGVTAVQFALLGAEVTALDISPESIAYGTKLAKTNNVTVDFRVANVEVDPIPNPAFDIVWCDNIFHHILPSLSTVLHKVHAALNEGGLFVAREPIEYARWLRRLRTLIPAGGGTTPDERSLRPDEINQILAVFPGANITYFELTSRLRELWNNTALLAILRRIDRAALAFPLFRRLAGLVVIDAVKCSNT